MESSRIPSVSNTRVDRLKEEIGWLKVPFGLLAVIDASLLGWLAQFYDSANLALVLAASVATIAVTGSLIMINRVAYRRIGEIERS